MTPVEDVITRQAVAALLTTALSQRGRGAKVELARSIGVQPATVSKWVQAQTLPEQTRWEAIERSLDLPAGSIGNAAGRTTAGEQRAMTETIERLEAQVREAHDLIERLSNRLDALAPEVG